MSLILHLAPIAALPDAYRALDMVSRLSRCALKTDDEERYYRILITESQCKQLDDVLKKAKIK